MYCRRGLKKSPLEHELSPPCVRTLHSICRLCTLISILYGTLLCFKKRPVILFSLNIKLEAAKTGITDVRRASWSQGWCTYFFWVLFRVFFCSKRNIFSARDSLCNYVSERGGASLAGLQERKIILRTYISCIRNHMAMDHVSSEGGKDRLPAWRHNPRHDNTSISISPFILCAVKNELLLFEETHTCGCIICLGNRGPACCFRLL